MENTKLKDKNEFMNEQGEWLSKYNLIYAITLIIAILFGISDGFYIGFIFTLFLCGGAFLIKQQIAKTKMWYLSEYKFSFAPNMPVEDIIRHVSHLLLSENILTSLEDGQLTFKGESASYSYVYDEEQRSFSLRHYYSLGKALFRVRYIGDYEEVLTEMSTIAYYIQNIM